MNCQPLRSETVEVERVVLAALKIVCRENIIGQKRFTAVSAKYVATEPRVWILCAFARIFEKRNGVC